jgi:putative phosphoribosyl transferase
LLKKRKNNMLNRFKDIIHIPVKNTFLTGELILPDESNTLVIFSHGSGSSRLSPRNNFVATAMQEKGIGTLLVDLLTEEEDLNYETRFNIHHLTERLIQVTEYITGFKWMKNQYIGYFGASTGAASALNAAAANPSIRAVVSRGGRPDLAIASLPYVQASTLLIVGGMDYTVIEYNRNAFNHLLCPKQMEIIPGATHLFEEPGTLEKVAELAANWFDQHLEPQMAAGKIISHV